MNTSAAWYRQPILWLGGALFAATVAGCIAMIVLGARHDDEPLPGVAPTILKMPAERHDPAARAAPAPAPEAAQ
ncbi:MAG: hypothetical protein AMXMBFR37_03210 [Steroidobacteraceae bacterium]